MVDLKKLDLAVMARQLGKPEGEIGRAVAAYVSEHNAKVNAAAWQRLDLHPRDRILEIGFGNGRLIPPLLALAPELAYTGVDHSETMIAEATAFNRARIDAGRIKLELASVESMPFAAGSFDRAVLINTLYFLPDPARAFAELHRVLRPEGVLVLAGIVPESAAKLPISKHGFRAYSRPKLEEMCRAAGFQTIDFETHRETAHTMDGLTHERIYDLTRAVA